jgi:Retroviral aspartyl protease
LQGLLQDPTNKAQSQQVKILFDSGASKSIISNKVVPKNKLQPQQHTTTWTTVAGSFLTHNTTLVTFKIPVLHESRIVQSLMYVAPGLEKYDIIIGRDLLQELGIILNFKDITIQWDNAVISMPCDNNQ